MIPKIIHLCWLSGDEYPQDIKQCIESWHKHLPDYEIWVWDTKRFDINSTIWTKEAFKHKKYAFAADYIRLYALYHYGGIYLDSDVLVYKNFNDLLSLPYFMGEDIVGSFEAAIIGAEKHCTWIKDVLEHYQNRHFYENGTFDMLALPGVFYYELKDKYKFKKLKTLPVSYPNDNNTIFIFPQDYFNSRNRTGIIRTANSYCAHNYKGSWTKKGNKLKDKIKAKIPLPILNYILFFTNILHKKRLTECAIPYDK